MYDSHVCKNCVYFHKDKKCRYNPPVILLESNIDNKFIHISVFPEISKNEWCGKFALSPGYKSNKLS